MTQSHRIGMAVCVALTTVVVALAVKPAWAAEHN